MKGMSKKRLHNYMILVVIFLLCMAVVLYLCRWYEVYNDYQKETPVIRGFIQEIVYDDLEHYVLDNPTTVLYLCTSNDDACRSFEKDFKKLMKKQGYYDEITYLNLTALNQEEFVSSFNNKYHYKNKLTTNYPAFVLFEDGKVKNILQGSEDKKLTMSKVKQFLEINEIGE